MNKQDLRLTLLIQVFTILLVVKSIGATYLATYYSIHLQDQLAWRYGHALNLLAIFLILPLIILIVNIIFPLSERWKRRLEITAVILTALLTLISLLIF